MSNLITFDNIYLGFGLEPLLDHIKFQIAFGERVCLIGRNGAGKSSLLKVIEGTLLPDSGEICVNHIYAYHVLHKNYHNMPLAQCMNSLRKD